MRNTIITLAVLVLAGCDAITSHPAIPDEARQIVKQGINEVRGLAPEVRQFVSGFGFAGEEARAVSQMADSMLNIFNINDTASLVRAGVEIKRAQACLITVGLEGSGIIEDLKRVVFADERGRKLWDDMNTYVENAELPAMEGAVCNHARPGAA